jgi:hypothetical protein
MKRAAIGVRMHSGWGALVAVSSTDGSVEIVGRWRIDVIPRGAAAAKQPYHYAENLELSEAEKFLASCFDSSRSLAFAAVKDVVGALRSRQYGVICSAVIQASGRPLPPLPKILGSHALIHAAEGEFFRAVFRRACEELELPVTGIPQRDLNERFDTVFGKAASRIRRQISAFGRTLGPPWTQDQKRAALAGLLAAAEKQT